MFAEVARIRGYKAFQTEFVGLDDIKKINILIGRNNSGKSALIDFVRMLCRNTFPDNIEVEYEIALSEDELKQQFRPEYSGGDFAGNHWQTGREILGQRVRWKVASNKIISGSIDAAMDPSLYSNKGQKEKAQIQQRLANILQNKAHEFKGRHIFEVTAERDIRPEKETTSISVSPDGGGATNLVRRLLLTSDPSLPRELVSNDLLSALNVIFDGDAYFNEIQVQYHDHSGHESTEGRYEICLGEEGKGLIPLSKSGSGLKTILLALVNLIVLPKLTNVEAERCCFCFEELENNLHPALLRRLFSFIERQISTTDCVVFISTHSSTVIDFFGRSEETQIIAVKNDKTKSTRLVPASRHLDQIDVVQELGGRASDLMMSNGVIWVEGPSDRIYINRWIEIISGGVLKEGSAYQIAFYGGSLLARNEFKDPAYEIDEFVNLLRINTNFVVVCDSDRSAPTGKGSGLKARVKRVKGEIDALGRGLVWITGAREIENYLSADVVGALAGMPNIAAPNQYESLWVSDRANSQRNKSYIEYAFSKQSIDKIKLAREAVQYMSSEHHIDRFDLLPNVRKIVESIKRWN